MTSKLGTLVFDNLTGSFDLAKAEQFGDPTLDALATTRGDWGLQWNKMMGQHQQMMRLCRQISELHGTTVFVIGHVAEDHLWMGVDAKGNTQKKLIGWKVALPGSGADEVLVPLDEVYHLMAIPLESGSTPQRKLFTQPHLIQGYEFPAKTRKGVKGPILNPTHASILKAVPPGVDAPKTFLIVGKPGAGKTTLAATGPEPRVFIDMLGGCDEMAKLPATKVLHPASINDIFRTLLTLKGRGYM